MSHATTFTIIRQPECDVCQGKGYTEELHDRGTRTQIHGCQACRLAEVDVQGEDQGFMLSPGTKAIHYLVQCPFCYHEHDLTGTFHFAGHSPADGELDDVEEACPHFYEINGERDGIIFRGPVDAEGLKPDVPKTIPAEILKQTAAKLARRQQALDEARTCLFGLRKAIAKAETTNATFEFVQDLKTDRTIVERNIEAHERQIESFELILKQGGPR